MRGTAPHIPRHDVLQLTCTSLWRHIDAWRDCEALRRALRTHLLPDAPSRSRTGDCRAQRSVCAIRVRKCRRCTLVVRRPLCRILKDINLGIIAFQLNESSFYLGSGLSLKNFQVKKKGYS